MQCRIIDMLDSRFSKEVYLAILSDGSDEIELKALILKKIALTEKLITTVIVIDSEEYMSEIETLSSVRSLPCLVIRDKGRDLMEIWDYDDAIQYICFDKKQKIVIQGTDIAPALHKEFETKETKAKLDEVNKRKEAETKMIRDEDYRKLGEVLKGWCGFRDAVKTFAQSAEGREDACKIKLVERMEQVGHIFQDFFKKRLSEIEGPLTETITKARELSQKQIQ